MSLQKSIATFSLVFTLVLGLQSANAAVYEQSSDLSERIVVTKISKDVFSFQLCENVVLTNGLKGTLCRNLGKKSSYTRNELEAEARHLRTMTYVDGGADIAGVAIVGAIAFFGVPFGAMVGLNAVGAASGVEMAGSMGVATTTGAIGAAIQTKVELSIDTINPFLKRAEKAALENSEEMASSDSVIQVKSIKELAKKFNLALSEIK